MLHGVAWRVLLVWHTKFQVIGRTAMLKLSEVMRQALEFYSEDHTAEAVAYPRTGTRVALITRGLLTTGVNAWDHTLTANGWAALRAGVTMAELHALALEINAEVTAGVREGQDCLDQTEQRLVEQELTERIERRRELLDAYITGVESRSYKGRRHELRMVKAHAFWLGLYVAERDRRSRLEAVNTYSAAVHNGLAQRGLLRQTPLIEIHQAIQDLLHGEALEQFRATRPVKGCSCGSNLPAWECELLTSHREDDALDELVADIQAAETRGDVTPEGGVILRPIGTGVHEAVEDFLR
jgi:hypothetical protein